MKAFFVVFLMITGITSISSAMELDNNSEVIQKKVIYPPMVPGPVPSHPPVYPPHPAPPVYPPIYPPAPNHGLVTEYITCMSANFSYFQCGFNPWGVVNVRLIQVNSTYACYPNQTFGVLPDRVWVSNGCAGTFEILRQVY